MNEEPFHEQRIGFDRTGTAGAFRDGNIEQPFDDFGPDPSSSTAATYPFQLTASKAAGVFTVTIASGRLNNVVYGPWTFTSVPAGRYYYLQVVGTFPAAVAVTVVAAAPSISISGSGFTAYRTLGGITGGEVIESLIKADQFCESFGSIVLFWP